MTTLRRFQGSAPLDGLALGVRVRTKGWNPNREGVAERIAKDRTWADVRLDTETGPHRYRWRLRADELEVVPSAG